MVQVPTGTGVVIGVVVEHSLVVQVASPKLLHTQVLQSTLNSSPGLQVLEQSITPLLQKQVPRPDTNVSPESPSLQAVVLLSAPGQVDGQYP